MREWVKWQPRHVLPVQRQSASLLMLQQLLLLFSLLLPGMALAFDYQPEAVPLLLPSDVSDDGGGRHRSSSAAAGRLEVSERGAAFLSSLGPCVAPVVVIGPYRSGKSFTLNQLLRVDCEHGFGVGHSRATETRGIWAWGQPQPLTLKDGSTCQLVFVDTEGFEGTGKGNAYDDRIFALSALLSSLLIYNLPEAIRESDIAKLSFAVQLAEGLFARQRLGSTVGLTATASTPAGRTAAAGPAHVSGSFEPGGLLFLIQRDFLEGSGAQQAVETALATVPNPQNDPEVAALNRVRASLSSLAADTAGFSLPQPHLQRTRLCELPDEALDPGYRAARDGLRQKVQTLARPKVVGGRRVSGQALAALLSKVTWALNQQEIPSVANLLDTFNKQLVWRAVAQYRALLAAVPLPVEEKHLHDVEIAAQYQAMHELKESLLGNQGLAHSGTASSDPLATELLEALRRELHVRLAENRAASNEVCGREELRCEEELEGMRLRLLPSSQAFEAATLACDVRFNASCAGPARPAFVQRLRRAQASASASFSAVYNDRLYTGLVVLCLAGGAVLRWALRLRPLDLLFWAAFAWLQLAPHLTFGAFTVYETRWWRAVVRAWEVGMWALQLQAVWLCVLAGVCGCAVWRWRTKPSARWRLLGRGGPLGLGGRKQSADKELDV